MTADLNRAETFRPKMPPKTAAEKSASHNLPKKSGTRRPTTPIAAQIAVCSRASPATCRIFAPE